MKRHEKRFEGSGGTLRTPSVAEPDSTPLSADLLRVTILEARDAAHKFELLLESAPDAVIGVDIEGNIVLANAQTERLFGYTKDELLGQPVEMLLPDAVRRVHVRHRESYGASPHIRSMGAGMDLEARRKDGSRFPVEVSLSPLETKDGLLVTSIVRDVTQRKEVEQALRRSEENFRTLFERAPYGIYRSTPNGRYVMANPAMIKLLGYESEDELKKLDIGTDVYQDSELRDQLVAEYEDKEILDAVELNWKRKDGTPITVRINGRVVRDSEKRETFYEVVVEDITERKLLEAQFRQAQKMEAIGRLAGGIAHDFNNLLMVIQGFGELLDKSLEAGHSARRPLQEILGAAQRATNLTRQLLSFSRRDSAHLAQINLNEIVFGLEQMLRRMIREDIALTTVLADDLELIEADPGQIEQIIVNLAVNARDAMPDGGRLRIETNNVALTPEGLSVFPGMDAGSFVRVRVSDTGEGMDAETQMRIFEPFFTTKEHDQGTGLGLANVYAIVRQAGGQITVFSSPGDGTRFDIYFPRCAPAQASAVKIEQPLGRLSGNETILLVEDEDALRHLAREFLQGMGYQILPAANGKEAIEVAVAYPGPIDLLISDMVMPGMSGAELAEYLQARRNDMRVLFMSGYSPKTIPRLGLDGRPSLFLQKPFPLATLAAHIRQALAAQ